MPFAMSIFDERKAGHPESYYNQRDCMIDCRGPLKISPLSYFGFGVKVITQTHSIATGQFDGPAIDAGVIVDDYAWITSFAILHNCHVKHHGIVAIGAVVNGMTVEPYTIVAGNPAKVVAKWNGEKWVKIRSSYGK